MTYILTYVLLDVTTIVYYLAYVAPSRHTSEGTENAAQYASVAIEEITIEVNAKCLKLLSMRLDKSNVASL